MVKLLLEHRTDPVEADTEPWATPAAWAKKPEFCDRYICRKPHISICTAGQ
jgi:hypothetical protein